jgi:hypothetical protein
VVAKSSALLFRFGVHLSIKRQNMIEKIAEIIADYAYSFESMLADTGES